MTCRDCRHPARDRGSATLWTVAVALLVMMSTAAVMLIAIAISARHRVATAADLSALAAASALASAQMASARVASAQMESSDPTTSATNQACRAARDVAQANGARLSECQVDGPIVDVVTTATVPALRYLGSQSVSAHARAGPS